MIEKIAISMAIFEVCLNIQIGQRIITHSMLQLVYTRVYSQFILVGYK